MADVKISALPASTTPLAGTEVLPIVQSSTTRQVSVANLTAGRAVSALSITASGLTSGRVTYATTSGLLTDSANMTFDGSTLTTLNTAYTGTLTGGTGIVNLGSGQFYKDASGNVGVGTTSPTPTNASTITPKFVAVGSGVASGIQAVRTNTPGVGGANIIVSATRGTDATSYTALQSGDGIGTFAFYGTDGTQFISAASIAAQVDSAVGTSSVPTRLTFGTSTTGANSITERMRIDSNGNIAIGSTVNNVFDQVGAPRPLLVQKSDTSTTIAGSLASITISNGDTTTNNTAQINFAAITGASTNQYSAATISAVFGARTNATYPSGQLVFSTSTATSAAPTEKMRIDSSGNVGVGTTTMNGKFNSTPKATYNASSTTWAESALSTAGSYGGGLSMIDGTAGYGLNVESSGGVFVIRQGTVGSAPTERMRIDSSGNV